MATGAPPDTSVAASSTRTGPVEAAVPTLVTVMRQDTKAVPASEPSHALVMRKPGWPPLGWRKRSVAQALLLARSTSPGMAFTSAQFSTVSGR